LPLKQLRGVEPDLPAIGAGCHVEQASVALDQRLGRDFAAQNLEQIVLVAGVADRIGGGFRAVASGQEPLQTEHEQEPLDFARGGVAQSLRGFRSEEWTRGESTFDAGRSSIRSSTS